jgi:pyrroline-5-carboxylate reductase
MQHPFLKIVKIGFIGAGNMTQALIEGLVKSEKIKPSQITVSNRTPGKLIKLKENFNVEIAAHNEEVIEHCDVIILAMKPQDMPKALQELTSQFRNEQIIISLAAGINMNALEKLIPTGRISRMMPNTPSVISRGVIGLLTPQDDESSSDLVKSLFSHLGQVINVESEDQFDALMISCSSGTGFVYELMMYWQEWIQEHGFDQDIAKKMTIETFAGAALLAAQSSEYNLEELQNKVASKKGVTAAGLDSMRELEIERTLRISFEKAFMRSEELLRQNRI